MKVDIRNFKKQELRASNDTNQDGTPASAPIKTADPALRHATPIGRSGVVPPFRPNAPTRAMTEPLPSLPHDGKRPDHELHLVFANGSSDRFVLDDLVRQVTKRQVLSSLLFLAILLALIAPQAFRAGMGQTAFAVATALNFLLFAPVFFGSVLLLSAVSRRDGGARIFEPLVTFTTTILVSQTGRVIGSLFDGGLSLQWTSVLLDIAVHYALWQTLTTLFFVFVVPSQRKHDALAQADAESAQSPEMFRLGRLTLDPDCIRHIEADDHYLVIRAGKAELRVLGRLSEAASQLASRGMVIHRSHWLAYCEFGPVARHGRTFQMMSRLGLSLPVSREKWREVREIAQAKAVAS